MNMKMGVGTTVQSTGHVVMMLSLVFFEGCVGCCEMHYGLTRDQRIIQMLIRTIYIMPEMLSAAYYPDM